MMVFNHPYVGTEHFFLAFLKKHKMKSISFSQFREYIKTIIGYGTISSKNVLYTPILRDVKNHYSNEYDAIIKILENEDSIVHSLLVCKKINIDNIITEVRTME